MAFGNVIYKLKVVFFKIILSLYFQGADYTYEYNEDPISANKARSKPKLK